MIDWSSKFGRKVKRHLKQEYVIWLTTLGPDQTPQPRPVWFVWDGEAFLIYSKPDAHKLSHIRANSKVALNFNTDETGDGDVIVFLGKADFVEAAPPANELPAYVRKYRAMIADDLRMTVEEYGRQYSVAIRVTPVAVRGW